MNEVFWVQGDPAIKLAIVLCPRGDRLLRDDLRVFKRNGVDALVSLSRAGRGDVAGPERGVADCGRSGNEVPLLSNS